MLGCLLSYHQLLLGREMMCFLSREIMEKKRSFTYTNTLATSLQIALVGRVSGFLEPTGVKEICVYYSISSSR